jgi:hypothetical protein
MATLSHPATSDPSRSIMSATYAVPCAFQLKLTKLQEALVVRRHTLSPQNLIMLDCNLKKTLHDIRLQLVSRPIGLLKTGAWCLFEFETEDQKVREARQGAQPLASPRRSQAQTAIDVACSFVRMKA